MSGLNYPVGGAFHLDPGLLLFITDGAWLHSIVREIHSVEENEKVHRRQRSVVDITSSSIKLSKAIQSPLGLHKLAHHVFFIAGDYPLSSRIKTFLGLLPLVLVGVVFPQR